MRKTSNSNQEPKTLKPADPDAPPSSPAGRATQSRIISSGEVFADGAILELVSGSPGRGTPDLLLWDGKKTTVGFRVEHGGCIYEAPELPPTLYRATRLPSRCSHYGSARDLFTAITELFKRHLDLADRESGLLASFSISTWVADCLVTAPNLTISGVDQALGLDILRLLTCVSRHPLLLAELTPSGFRSLPMDLSLTLLLMQSELKPNMLRLLRASSHRGLHMPGTRGRIVDHYGPKAIFCGNDDGVPAPGDAALHISAPPSQSQSSALDERVQNEIANHFQPRLLMYRLRNLRKVLESPVDLPKFIPPMRQLARTLCACFPDDAELAGKVVDLMRPQEEEVRGSYLRDINCAIVEILCAIVHDGKQREVRVDDLMKDVNALLRSRGETLDYSAEEIGWKLKNLGIPRHTVSSGRQVLLGRDTSQIVHRLARAYDLACSQRFKTGCADCSQKQVVSK